MGDLSREEMNVASGALTPTRSTEVARLQIAQLTIESGMTLTALFQQACRIASETLNISRVSVWMMVEQSSALKCVSLFDAASNRSAKVCYCMPAIIRFTLKRLSNGRSSLQSLRISIR